MSVEDLLKELEGAKQYMEARPRASGPGDSVAKTFATHLHKMISVCQFLSPHDAAKLTSALSGSSPYNESDTKHLMDGIDKEVGAISGAKGRNMLPGNRGQLLEHWRNYITEKDWSFL